MAAIIGLGLTHYPMLAGADTHMANLLKGTLRDPDIPEDAAVGARVLIQDRDALASAAFNQVFADAGIERPALSDGRQALIIPARTGLWPVGALYFRRPCELS
jgi:hypothetical protein